MYAIRSYYVLKQGVENLLTSELDEELGYDKYDRIKEKDNYRNGYFKKTVRSDLGELDLKIPRYKNNEFEPELVPKNARDISAIEDKVILMYAKGMSTRDISSHIEDLYGIPLPAEFV